MSKTHSKPQKTSWMERLIARSREALRRVNFLGDGAKSSRGWMIGLVVCALLVGVISLAALGPEGSRKSEATPAASASTATNVKPTPAPKTAAENHASSANGEQKPDPAKETQSQDAGQAQQPATPANSAPFVPPPPPAQREEKNYLREREEWFLKDRRLSNGSVATGLRLKALRHVDAMRAAEKLRGVNSNAALAPTTFLGPTSWTLIGPQPLITAGPRITPFNGGPNNSGRVSAIAVDPKNSNIAYLGAAAGGVWKTTNAGALWTPMTDSLTSILTGASLPTGSIGSIAIDPTTASCGASGPCQIIYVGTGEANNSGDSYYGVGILKSVDGGVTWTQQGASTFVGVGSSSRIDGGAHIGALAVDPNNNQIVLAGVQFVSNSTNSGIYRTTNGGTSWAPVAGMTGATGSAIVFDPTNAGVVYAALGQPFGSAGNGVYRSTNDGATWTKLTGSGANLFPTANVGRIDIDLARSTVTTLYAAVGKADGTGFLGMFKTMDSGANWTNLAATPNVCTSQCFYDLVVRVDPTDVNTVFYGGSTAATNQSNVLFRSSDGGASWTTAATGANGAGIHADLHALTFAIPPDADRLYVGSDGGAWSTDNPTASPATSINYNDLNSTLAITMHYPGHTAHVSDENVGLSGAQDNGSSIYLGNLAWNQVLSGDGGYTAQDRLLPSTVYTTAQHIFITQSLVGGDPNPPFNSVFALLTNGINMSDRSSFIAPLVHDESISGRLYFGTFQLYMTADAANSWTSISPDLTSGAPSTINAIAVSRSDSNVVYVGTDAFGTTSRIQRTTNALSSSPTWTDLTNAATLPTGRTISSIGVDRDNPDIVYVAFSGFSGCQFCLDNMGHVFRTSDGGTTWQDISGTGGTALPNAPANSILVDQQLPNTVFVGTDVGVFRTSDASQGTGTVWTTVGTGLPNVIVLGLSGRGSRIVRASTSGRSTWVIQDNNVPIPPGPVLSSVHPAIAVVGSATIPAVVVDGANFTGTSQVQWNGSSTGITTHFSGNANQMTIDIDTSLLASPQVANVTVADSSQIPSLSDKLRFTVVNPLPAPTFLSPISTNAGSSVTLTMTGSKFICGSNPTQVTFNGVSHNPDAGAANCTSTKIIATIPPAETGTPGNVFVSAVNPPPGGGGGPFVIGAFRFSINAVGGASAGFSPAALSFSNQATTTTSAAQTVTLTSTGGASLTTTSIAKTGTNSGDFVLDTSATGACKTTGQALAPTQSCTFAVTFAPTAGGLRSASITVADTGAGSPQVISLSGTGVVVNPLSVSISPNTVNFASTAVSSTSSQQLAHVTNNGTSLLNLGAPTITGANSGDFAVVAPSTGTDCRSSATLAVNKSCVYALTFTPLASGTRVATLNIADNAPGNPHTVSLVGPATGGAAVSLSPANIPFGNQKVGTSSATTDLTITNNGSAQLNITSITLTGTDPTQFTLGAPTSGAACPLGASNLAASASCKVGVKFAPTTTGAKSANVSVADNATGSPQTVPLTGTGAVPVAGLAPANIAFGNQTIATSSATSDVTLSNTGQASMNITSITLTGTDTTQFALVAPTSGTACPLGASSLNAGASCKVGVQFAPTTIGAKSASVSVADDAAGSPQTVLLTGTGVNAPVPVVTLNPTSLAFGNQKVGTTSGALNATLTNTGNANLNITGVSITGTNLADFSSSGTTCTGTTVLTQNQSCTLGATFTPGAQGARAAAFTITDNASGSPHSLPLNGTGTIPGVGLAPANIAFGNLPINTTSATTDVTLTNSGLASLNITSITLTGTDPTQFMLGAPTTGTACPLGASSLAAAASCKVGVNFAPTTTGGKSASVSFVDDAAGSPQTVPLTGTGTAPGITLAPTNIAFGSKRTGTSTAATDVTITNSGTATLNITSITVTGTDPTQFTLGAPTTGTACALGASALTAGSSCKVGVKFAPTTTGAKSANMSVADDATGSPQTVLLTGTGTAPAVTFAAVSVAFGNQATGMSSATTDVTITNSGTAAL